MEQLASNLVPIVAILSTFGFPVAIIFVFKWFKLREKELQFDAETRREMNAAVEARVQRLESVLLQLEPQLQRRELMAGPPDLRVTERPDGGAGFACDGQSANARSIGDPLPLLRKDVRG